MGTSKNLFFYSSSESAKGGRVEKQREFYLLDKHVPSEVEGLEE